MTLFDEEGVTDALRLAGELRTAGIRVEVYPEADKLGKQFKYAAARTLRFVTVVGGDERAAGQVTVKNMRERRTDRCPPQPGSRMAGRENPEP